MNDNNHRTDKSLVLSDGLSLTTVRSELVKRGLSLINTIIKTVLIVDDDEQLLEVLKTGLEKYNKLYQVILAQNGQIAIDKLKKYSISLVVTDLMMPKINGFGVLSHIRENYPHIPVIMMTVHEERENQAYELGAAEFILKPLTLDYLAKKIIIHLKITKLILLVDDDREMLLSLKDGLEKYHESFSIIFAFDGQEAIEKLKQYPKISLVTTCLKMPKVNGFVLLAHIKENYPNIPVIIATAYGGLEKDALERGAVAYIEKPFMVDDFAKMILDLLRGQSEGGMLHKVSSEMFLQLIEVEQRMKDAETIKSAAKTILKPDDAEKHYNLENAYYNEGTITDIDGNVYKTIKIGNQVWMAENLKTIKYNDGTPIPLVTKQTAWKKLTTPGYCWHDNDIKNKSKYGALYNWYAVDTKKLAPKGWHVPTDAEWTILEKYLIVNGYNWDGTTTGNKLAKSLAAKTDWMIDSGPGVIGNDLTKNNKSGFSALPGSYRDFHGHFYNIGESGYWWSSLEDVESNVYNRYLYYVEDFLHRYYDYKSCGFSVRLLRD